LIHLVSCEKLFQIFVIQYFHHVPVVQSCPADGFFGNVKAEGADQVQPAAGGGAGAGNVSAVLGDLRFYENDIQHFVTSDPKFALAKVL
jgi:hypothetical protein